MPAPAAASRSGAGSLRQEIISSDAVKGPNAINFNIPGGGVHTINPLSALPTLTQPVTINGTTEHGSAGKPVIRIDGTKAGTAAIGLDLTSAASGSTIKGLSITDLTGGGVLLNGAAGGQLQHWHRRRDLRQQPGRRLDQRLIEQRCHW